MSTPLTGLESAISRQFIGGALLGFERANQAGGVQGRKIRLLTLDDGYQPERCAANVQRLIHQDGVHALFGLFGTATTQAAIPTIQQTATPLFAPLTGAESLRNPFSPYLWHIRASYHEEVEALIEQLTHVGLNQVAVAYQNDAFGLDGVQGVRKALALRNLQMQAIASVPRQSTDVMPAVEALKPHQPHAIILVLPHEAATAFVSAWRKQSMAHATTALRALSVVDANALRLQLGDAATGLGLSQVVPFLYDARLSPIASEYIQVANDPQDREQNISFSGFEGYIAAQAFVAIMKKTRGKIDRDSLVETLRAAGKIALGGFQLQYGARQNSGSNFVELIALKGKHGFVR